MTELVHYLLSRSAERQPEAPAVTYAGKTMCYAEMDQRVGEAARGYLELGLVRGERVGIYLEKRLETVAAQLGAAAAGGVFVPINPMLRARQAAYILKNCEIRILVTSKTRLDGLAEVLGELPDLQTIVLVDGEDAPPADGGLNLLSFDTLLSTGAGSPHKPHRVLDQDMAAILFTSGSTGMPKGVVLSHLNLVASAKSASEHLNNTHNDRILCVLPFSFDYGIVQMTSAFNVGASLVLMNYLFTKDVLRAVVEERITGLAGVPPLWIPLADQDWPAEASDTLRYVTNSGGAMPQATLEKLRQKLPGTGIHLMYGLTEAFRSTCLLPDENIKRPTSIGKAIPNAEILVVRDDGTPCDPGEQGQIVHRGVFVSKGYWRNPEATAERFRPAPNQPSGLTLPEMAVWSGDIGWFDEEGYLFFVGRRDDQIKTSGYRVSPTEVEDLIYSTGLVGEVVAFGVPHAVLGQSIVVVCTAPPGGQFDKDAILAACRETMPTYMVPQVIVERASLPRTPNGKMDRPTLAREFLDDTAQSAAQ